MRDVTRVRGSISANGQAVSCPTENWPTVGLEITGIWVGTLALTDTVNGDDTSAATVFNAAGGAVSATITANGRFFVAAAGRSAIALTATAWTSGAATVVMLPTDGAAAGAAGGGGGGGAVTVADGADTALGTTTDNAISTTTTGATPATGIGLWRGMVNLLVSLISKLPAALTGSGNLKVSVAESTASQAITAASLPLPTGAAADTTLGTTNTEIGGLTETAPANDTASSGLNGRLQRVAQRLTSLIALLPTALISNRLDVNLGAAPATVTIASPTVVQGTQGAAGTASWNVQGAVASGVSVSGINPVLGGGTDGGGVMRTFIAQANNIDNVTSGQICLLAQAQGYAFNGTGVDRVRNNADVTVLASAARTTTQSGTITTYNLGAIKFILDMTVITAGPSVTLTISETDLASGKTVLLLSGAAVVTAVTNEYTVDPMVPAVANVSAQKRVPRTIFWQVTANNNNSGQYSLGSFQLPA